MVLKLRPYVGHRPAVNSALLNSVMTVNVALVGVGLVGKEVVSQLCSARVRRVAKLVSLHTSTSHLAVPAGSDPTSTEILDALKVTDGPSGGLRSTKYGGGLEAVVAALSDLPRPLVVCDCTSSQELAELYPRLLSQKAVHVVTPNKKAFSGSAALYRSVVENSARNRNLVYQEATVGAGLPIIGPLNDLLATGDRVDTVEGVFSGTLSAIFNEWSQPGRADGPKFSEVVKLAKANGYTEPHPGDDLNGSDVARKLCIIARLIEGQAANSLPDGYLSVPTESLVPEALAGEASGDAFVEKLAAHDQHFDRLRRDAASQGCVLRYVGTVKASPNGACEVRASLQSYPASHPFAASLGGSDNIVLFRTARYSPRPMIVQGAGAGAAVTAMGVVSDILRAAERVGAASA